MVTPCGICGIYYDGHNGRSIVQLHVKLTSWFFAWSKQRMCFFYSSQELLVNTQVHIYKTIIPSRQQAPKNMSFPNQKAFRLVIHILWSLRSDLYNVLFKFALTLKRFRAKLNYYQNSTKMQVTLQGSHGNSYNHQVYPPFSRLAFRPLTAWCGANLSIHDYIKGDK